MYKYNTPFRVPIEEEEEEVLMVDAVLVVVEGGWLVCFTGCL